MNRIIVLAGITLAFAGAAPLAAQQKVAPVSPRDTTAAAERAATVASADSASVELARALTELAASVQKIVAETANKPEVRLAAVKVAGHAVTLAQKTISENIGEIDRVLAEASRELSKAEVAQKEKVEKGAKVEKPAKP